MTITMNTNVYPGALTSGPELAKEDLQEFVNLGLLTKVSNHKEHYAIKPCWIQEPANGVLEEINRNVLGRWNNKLKAYVVAVKNIRNYDNSAAMNEDHRWLHVDVVATYYTFSPEEGQRLKGEIKKVGNRAAICIIFDVFTVTVFAKDDTELNSWHVGENLQFEIYSFTHRRKGPIIRAKSLSELVNNTKRKFLALEAGDDEWDYEKAIEGDKLGVESSLNEVDDLDESRSSRKEKKKKKIKIKQEPDDSYDNEQQDISLNYIGDNQNQESVEPEEEGHSKKKKKKKKKSSRDD